MKDYRSQGVASPRCRKSQGAFEYILLLGGVLLIVVVSIIILRGSVLNQANKQIVGNTNAWQNTVCIPTYLGDSGAVGVWHFEGDATDSSGKGNHGTLIGDAGFASGKAGKALNPGSDGNNGFMVPDSSSLNLANGMTLEAWIKPTSNVDEPVIAQEGPLGLAYIMHIAYSVWNLNALMDSNGANPWDWDMPDAVKPELNNQWAHIAVTWDGTTAKNYVNGNFVTSAGFAGPIYNSGASIGIGTNGDWHTTHFHGLIDEAIIYNRALSQTEIQKDMNCMG